MGTVAAPSYAIIYMGEFEEKHIYPIIGKDCLYYSRYIDDILLIYKGNEKEFKTFAEQLNTKHPSINSIMKSQRHLSLSLTHAFI